MVLNDPFQSADRQSAWNSPVNHKAASDPAGIGVVGVTKTGSGRVWSETTEVRCVPYPVQSRGEFIPYGFLMAKGLRFSLPFKGIG